MRNAWIATPTEEHVWLRIPAVGRELDSSFATPIEELEGKLKCSPVKWRLSYRLGDGTGCIKQYFAP
jgi:hypothetical protein